MPDKKLEGFSKLSFADITSYSRLQYRIAIALQGQNLVGEFRFGVENSRRESPLRGAQNANVVCRQVSTGTVQPVEHIMCNHAACPTKKSSTPNIQCRS